MMEILTKHTFTQQIEALAAISEQIGYRRGQLVMTAEEMQKDTYMLLLTQQYDDAHHLLSKMVDQLFDNAEGIKAEVIDIIKPVYNFKAHAKSMGNKDEEDWNPQKVLEEFFGRKGGEEKITITPQDVGNLNDLLFNDNDNDNKGGGVINMKK
jgi:hypothetical protein